MIKKILKKIKKLGGYYILHILQEFEDSFVVGLQIEITRHIEIDDSRRFQPQNFNVPTILPIFFLVIDGQKKDSRNELIKTFIQNNLPILDISLLTSGKNEQEDTELLHSYIRKFIKEKILKDQH